MSEWTYLEIIHVHRNVCRCVRMITPSTWLGIWNQHMRVFWFRVWMYLQNISIRKYFSVESWMITKNFYGLCVVTKTTRIFMNIIASGNARYRLKNNNRKMILHVRRQISIYSTKTSTQSIKIHCIQWQCIALFASSALSLVL